MDYPFESIAIQSYFGVGLGCKEVRRQRLAKATDESNTMNDRDREPLTRLSEDELGIWSAFQFYALVYSGTGCMLEILETDGVLRTMMKLNNIRVLTLD